MTSEIKPKPTEHRPATAASVLGLWARAKNRDGAPDPIEQLRQQKLNARLAATHSRLQMQAS